jgi:hypothetical protein
VLQAGKKFAKLAMGKRTPQKQNTTPVFFPATQGGINAVSAASDVPPQDALLLINLIPAEKGVRVRKGWIEHCIAVPLGDGIKTLVPFTHQDVDAPIDKLFGLTSDGIYDVTTPAVAPVKVFDFPIKSGEAGWAQWTHYTTIAGQFILLTDKANGYIVYTASTDTWAAGSISADPSVAPAVITPALCVFVMVWKNRVWFIEVDTGTAWYLPVGTYTGATAKPFYFGNKFKYGGYLKSLWNWTLDGGEGVDDYLVAVGSAGDMVVYKGTDPATVATFNQSGWWYIGKPLQGRRQGANMGGELLLTTNFGVLQTSKLIAGQPVTDQAVSMSYKINPAFNQTSDRMGEFYGWEPVFIPKEQLMMFITPKEVGQPYLQYVYNTATRAWCVFIDMPVKTGVMWKNKFYFGTDDNRIASYDGFLDEVYLDPLVDGTFEPIQWESLTGFQGFNQPSIWKRVQFMRPLFIGAATPVFKIVAKYDFDLTPPAGSPVFPPTTGGVWGIGIWDFSTWGGGYFTTKSTKGGSGMGRYVALYMRGRSSTEIVHVGTDVLYDGGGLL